MELHTGRSYGATNKPLLWSYKQAAPMELQTGRTYGATNRPLLWSFKQAAPMELQTGRSYGATNSSHLRCYLRDAFENIFSGIGSSSLILSIMK
jgi:hypothetical protein